MSNTALNNVKYVKIGDRNIAVKKLGLIKYSEMVDSFQELIKSVNEMINIDDTKDDTILAQIVSQLIKKNIDQVIKFLTIAIDDLDYDFVANEVGITDVIRLLSALIEVNELITGIDEVKKLLAALTKK